MRPIAFLEFGVKRRPWGERFHRFSGVVYCLTQGGVVESVVVFWLKFDMWIGNCDETHVTIGCFCRRQPTGGRRGRLLVFGDLDEALNVRGKRPHLTKLDSWTMENANMLTCCVQYVQWRDAILCKCMQMYLFCCRRSSFFCSSGAKADKNPSYKDG